VGSVKVSVRVGAKSSSVAASLHDVDATQKF
jgi:hypothetical protein